MDIRSNDDVAAAMHFAETTSHQLWVFGPTSKVSYRLYPLKRLGERFQVWDLVRSDQGFWTDPSHIPSLPIGVFSWEWLVGRIHNVCLHVPSASDHVWTRRSNQKETRLYHHILVGIGIRDNTGGGAFRVEKKFVEGLRTQDGQWDLMEGPDPPAVQAPLHDVVLLCPAEVRKSVAAKSACEVSSRKWGPEGMIRLRLSGLNDDAMQSLAQESFCKLAWSAVSATFQSGVTLCVEGDTWATLLPLLASSVWRSQVAHESHKWVTIGGAPDEILKALQGWGLTGMPVRAWIGLPGGLVSLRLVKVGDDTCEILDSNVPAALTVEDVQKLCAAAGVLPREASFIPASGEQGRQLRLVLSQPDAAKFCRWPIRWNQGHTFRFHYTKHEQPCGSLHPPCSNPAASKQNVTNTLQPVGIPPAPASSSRTPVLTTPVKPRRKRASSNDAYSSSPLQGDSARTHSRSARKEARPTRAGSSSPPNRQTQMSFNEDAGVNDEPGTSDPEGPCSDDDAWPIVAARDIGPSGRGVEWAPGVCVVAPPFGDEEGEVRQLLQLHTANTDGSWGAHVVKPLTAQSVRVEVAPRHKHGTGFIVKAPKLRPASMPATAWFFHKKYGHNAKAQADAKGNSMNQEIEEWVKSETRVVLTDDAASALLDVPCYSLSGARSLGANSLAFHAARLGVVLAIAAAKEAHHRNTNAVPKDANAKNTAPSGRPPGPGSSAGK